jgi:hypothetical protein
MPRAFAPNRGLPRRRLSQRCRDALRTVRTREDESGASGRRRRRDLEPTGARRMRPAWALAL